MDQIAAALLRTYARAAGEPDPRTRCIRQAIAARGAAWFGAELDQAQAEAAATLRPCEVGIFGAGLAPR